MASKNKTEKINFNHTVNIFTPNRNDDFYGLFFFTKANQKLFCVGKP